MSPALPAFVLADLNQKYVKGKPCKPYNSTLGEFFRVGIPCPIPALLQATLISEV
jgi:hypothetical protein